ncbi:dynamin GTPase-like protein [Bisporella sp. PMI_857]|nr:dynamin GTPase-like protein [Bisporella sp. PMI_857]
MGKISPPVRGIVGGLKNNDTEKKLAFIDELHALGVSKYVDLPQLVVVGDQSSGKSSVLQAITRLPFPVSDKMCTRFPTEVSLHRDSGPTTMTISINIDKYESSTIDDSHVERMQMWKPAPLSNIDLESSEFAQNFAEYLREGSQVILGRKEKNQELSGATLYVDIRGPEQSNLTIVDIPGLLRADNPTAGHEAHATARALVERYIGNPKSIVLAVAHPADPGTQEVFQILKNFPKKEARVIGVITKCDRKQEDADQWIFDTIKNERDRTNPHFLDQGWFGLRNRLPKEIKASNDERDEAEAAFFQQGVWKTLNQSHRLGINHLRTALVKMHNMHITQSIPELIPDIVSQLSICKSRLNELGTPRATRASQLQCIVSLASQFEKLSSYALDGFYDKLPEDPRVKIRKIMHETLEDFHDDMLTLHDQFFESPYAFTFTSLDKSSWEKTFLQHSMYNEIKGVIQENRGKESPGEFNPCVMGILWGRRTSAWAGYAKNVIEELLDAISQTVAILFKEICPDEELRENIQPWILENLNRVSDDAQSELETLVSDERNGLVLTLNGHRTTKIRELDAARLSDMKAQLLGFYPTNMAGSPEQKRIIDQLVKQWLGEREDICTIFSTYDRLSSYYGIAMNRFIDNVAHQVVERHLVGPRSPLRIFEPGEVVRRLQEDEVLLQKLAGENESKIAERKKLIAEMESLEAALKTARTYGLHPR